MSTFNMVCGFAPEAGPVLLMLGYDTPEKREAVPRLRDAYILRGSKTDEHRLVLLTRTGGSNREDYETENAALRLRPGFLLDTDDTFDNTFAHWVYTVPPEHTEAVAALVAAGEEAGWDFPAPMERFQRALDTMGSNE